LIFLHKEKKVKMKNSRKLTNPRGFFLSCGIALAAMVAPSGAQARETQNQNQNQVDEIILVFKTHFDIGYTKLASEVVADYRTKMIDNALGVVDAAQKMPEEKKFVWTVPGWPMAKIMENQPPKRAARIEKALRDGRLTVHALPFTTHSETLTEEDFVRSLRFAGNVSRSIGKEPPKDAKMTDVPCHSWFLPTLLAHSGVTFMHEGTNSGCYDPEVPLLYFREGPDGSRVLTMHVNGYGTGIDPPKNWRYKTWLGLIHTSDNHGPPRANEIEKLLQQCASKYPNAKVRIGRLADFGDAILKKENLDKIPIVKGDMPDTWIHGPMCDPQGQKIARRVHEQLASTEILGTLHKIATKNRGDFPTPKQLADAYEQSLLYGEHTWGGALYWIVNYGKDGKKNTLPFGDSWKKLWESQKFSPAYKRLMLSWEEHTNYIKKADEIIGAKKRAENSYYFNSLPWDIVTYRGEKLAPGQIAGKTERGASKPEIASGKIVTLESPFFRLTVNVADGKINLFDKKHKRDVFKETPPHFLYQRANGEMCDKFLKDYSILSANWVVAEVGKQGVPKGISEQRIIPEKIGRCEILKNGAEQSVRLIYKQQETLPFAGVCDLTITLSSNRPEARFQFSGINKRPDTFPEAGYFCFPLNIETPQFRLGRLGGIVDPARDIVAGSNRHFAWLRTGMAVFGKDGYGVGICPLDTPMVSLGETGGWKFSRNYVPKKADVYFNLFNNQWTTNFRFWNQGDISASFALWTFDKYDNESALITPSLEVLALNFPPDAALVESAAGGVESAGVRTSRKGIKITAFGEDADSGKLMLRMWEMSGQGGENPQVEVQLPPKLNAKTVTPCDLRNRPISGPIPVNNGNFKIAVKPFSPVNLMVE
jgi:hypothetical protein